MNIILLGPVNSIHLQRWADSLAAEGVRITVVSQHKDEAWSPVNNIEIIHLPFKGGLGYFLNAFSLKGILKKNNPDLMNVHYASGYGTTAALTGFRRYLLSVWGSDVYEFPEKSKIHKWIIAKNLKSAYAIASTSECMANQVRNLYPKLNDISITPFGVDTKKFLNNRKFSQNINLTIGTVKTLEDKYGIDTLLKAFNLLRGKLIHEFPALAMSLKLRIVGSGVQKDELEQLARHLKIDDVTTFVGAVPHSQVPLELANMDIFVALSRQESFGVAAIEAGAAGLPVVVSDAGGLPEVVCDKVTGLVVPKDNPEVASEALEMLVKSSELRDFLGSNGKNHVEENYAWKACVKKMINLYEKLINNSNH